MVTRVKKDDGGAERKTAAQLADTVKASAQQIWLAGLGAFSKAQEEGGKVFEALVQEGAAIQRKTQASAEDKLAEATSRMASMATELSAKATGQWDKLENIFEDRVARALRQLGVPTAADVEALAARVEELERRVATAPGGTGTTARRRPLGTAARSAAKAAPARKRPARKSPG